MIRSGVVVVGALLLASGCFGGMRPFGVAGRPAPPKQVRHLPLPTSTWAKPTNEEHYRVFASHAEAAAWFDAWKVTPRAAWHGSAKDVVIPESDARHAALAEDLALVWGTFRKLFPRDCEGLDAPQLLVTTGTNTNASVLLDRNLGEQSYHLLHLILVDVGLLGRSFDVATRDALRGLVAHELTHHVLKHLWPGHDKKVSRFYSAKTAKGSGFGFEQDDDPVLRKSGEKYIDVASTTGDYPLREWNGVVRDDSACMAIRQEIHRGAAKLAPELCAPADAARTKLNAQAQAIFDDTFASIRATPAQLVELDTLSKAYVAAESTCAAAYPKSLFGVTADVRGTTESDIREHANEAERKINDGASDAFDALVKLVKFNDELLLGMDVSTLRHYTIEEQADDVAVEVLYRLGADPLALTNFLEKRNIVGADLAACEKEIAAGEPTYGSLLVSHHSPCWRVAHGRALAKWLATPE